MRGVSLSAPCQPAVRAAGGSSARALAGPRVGHGPCTTGCAPGRQQRSPPSRSAARRPRRYPCPPLRLPPPVARPLQGLVGRTAGPAQTPWHRWPDCVGTIGCLIRRRPRQPVAATASTQRFFTSAARRMRLRAQSSVALHRSAQVPLHVVGAGSKSGALGGVTRGRAHAHTSPRTHLPRASAPTDQVCAPPNSPSHPLQRVRQRREA